MKNRPLPQPSTYNPYNPCPVPKSQVRVYTTTKSHISQTKETTVLRPRIKIIPKIK